MIAVLAQVREDNVVQSRVHGLADSSSCVAIAQMSEATRNASLYARRVGPGAQHSFVVVRLGYHDIQLVECACHGLTHTAQIVYDPCARAFANRRNDDGD